MSSQSPKRFGFIKCKMEPAGQSAVADGKPIYIGTISDSYGKVIARGRFPERAMVFKDLIVCEIVGETDGYYLLDYSGGSDFGSSFLGPISVPKELVAIPDRKYSSQSACCGEDTFVTTRVNNQRWIFCTKCRRVCSFVAFADW